MSIHFKTLSMIWFLYYNSIASHFTRRILYKDNSVWHSFYIWVIPWYKRSQLCCFWPIFVSPHFLLVLQPKCKKFSSLPFYVCYAAYLFYTGSNIIKINVNHLTEIVTLRLISSRFRIFRQNGIYFIYSNPVVKTKDQLWRSLSMLYLIPYY